MTRVCIGAEIYVVNCIWNSNLEEKGEKYKPMRKARDIMSWLMQNLLGKGRELFVLIILICFNHFNKGRGERVK